MLGSGFSLYQRNPTKKKRNIFQQLLESQKEEEEIAYPRGLRMAAMPRERGQTISPMAELSQRNSGQWRGGRRERCAARELAPRDHRTGIPSSQRATGSRILAVTVPSDWPYWMELKPSLLVRVHGRLLTHKMGLRWQNGRRISHAPSRLVHNRWHDWSRQMTSVVTHKILYARSNMHHLNSFGARLYHLIFHPNHLTILIKSILWYLFLFQIYVWLNCKVKLVLVRDFV